VRQDLAAAQAKGDEFAIRYYEGLLADSTRLSSFTVTSEAVFLQPAQAVVEAAIARDPRYGRNIPVVAIDEWPTGTLNAESVRFKEGFAVLLNAGSNILFHEVIAAMLKNSEGKIESEQLDRLATLLVEYANGLNLLSLSAPVIPELEKRIRLKIYCDALRNFIVAHEYGHILRGHFKDAPIVDSSTSAELKEQFIRKSWDQEFQADDTATELTLGKDFPTAEQQKTLVDADSSYDIETIRTAAELQAACAAPVIMFTIMPFFDLAVRVIRGTPKKTLYETHPPPYQRRERYVQWVMDRRSERHYSRSVTGGWEVASDLQEIEPILYDKLSEFLARMLEKGLMTDEEFDHLKEEFIAEEWRL
jgi:hypothetical protein